MPTFSRAEVEDAFAEFYALGCVEEDWLAWANLFTDDARYVEHYWGDLHGRHEVAAWIEPVMSGVPEIYTVLEWYAIDGARVVWSLQNRRDNPSDDGPAYFDFAGLSVAEYAGDGRWRMEEDYWDVRGARDTAVAYAAACERAGATFEQKLSRRFWPEGVPDWARGPAVAAPTWIGKPGIVPLTKRRQWDEQLAQLRAR